MSLPAEQFTVSVINPDELIWEGQARSVSSENSIGKFDILPEHANFVTIISGKPILIRTTVGEEVKELNYKNAVIAVNNNKVTIYADI